MVVVRNVAARGQLESIKRPRIGEQYGARFGQAEIGLAGRDARRGELFLFQVAWEGGFDKK